MRFWNHFFRRSGDVEMICMACGYVIGAPTTENEAQAFIREQKGEEWWCGGAWHRFDKRQIERSEHR